MTDNFPLITLLGAALVRAMEEESTGRHSRCRHDQHQEGRFSCISNTLDGSAGGGSWEG